MLRRSAFCIAAHPPPPTASPVALHALLFFITAATSTVSTPHHPLHLSLARHKHTPTVAASHIEKQASARANGACHMMTFSAFDPGATRMVFATERLGREVVGVEEEAKDNQEETKGKEKAKEKEAEEWEIITYPTFDPGARRPLSFSFCFPRGSSCGSGSSSGSGSGSSSSSSSTSVSHKPESSSLASTAQEEEMQEDGGMVEGKDKEKGEGRQDDRRVGFMQAVLYGVQDPESFSYRECLVRPGGLVHRVLFGVKEETMEKDKEEKVAVVRDTVVGVEIGEKHEGQMIAK